jgi:hypothetical protein
MSLRLLGEWSETVGRRDSTTFTLPGWVPLVMAVFVVGAAVGILVALLVAAHDGRRAAVDAPGALNHVALQRQQHPDRRARVPVRASTAALDPSRGAVNSLVPEGAAASFAHLSRQLPGGLGLAIAPLGEGSVRTFGALQTGHAWSTMKVPVLVAYLRALEESEATLDSSARRDATLAIEQSDNAAINAIFVRLETLYGGLVPASRTIEGLLRLAGDRATHVNTVSNQQGFSTFGQTEWSAAGSARFYRALTNGCLIQPEDTEYVLHLMGAVIPSERWGAGEAGYASGFPLAFKGGWGPEASGSYLVRQDAIVGSGDRGYVLSMVSAPTGSGYESFTTGQRILTAAATWARRTFDLKVTQPHARCTD